MNEAQVKSILLDVSMQQRAPDVFAELEATPIDRTRTLMDANF